MAAVNYKDSSFLIVDNQKLSRDLLKQFAMSLNAFSVDATHYARDVITLCQDKHYDIILLGYNLGDGEKNGQQILEELRLDSIVSRQCIIILITAEVSQEMVLAALEHKPDDYLSKPYTLGNLSHRLAKCFTKKRAMANIYNAMDQGKAQDVINLSSRALEEHTPYKNECLGIISRQHFELAEYEQAKQIYLTYQNTPNSQWAHIGLGKVALHEEDLAAAIQIFKALIQTSPLYLSSYDWLATTYVKQKHFINAELTMQSAIAISPLSVARLRRYAELSLKNEHFEQACDAFEKTYKLAYNSIHHSPDDALMVARSLIEYSKDLPLQQAKQMNNRAFKVLASMNKDFPRDDFKIQSNLLCACLYQNTNEESLTQEMIAKAEKQLVTRQKFLPKKSLIEIAKSLTILNRQTVAEKVLKEISSPYFENDNLSDNDKLEAQIANEVAMNLYKAENYGLAIRKLTKALISFPMHTALKLNLLQVLLVSYESNNNKTLNLEKSSEIINEMNGLHNASKSFERFSKLRNKYNNLCKKRV